MRVDAAYLDLPSSTLNLLFAEYNESAIKTITNTFLETKSQLLLNYFENSLKGFFKDAEQADPAVQLARDIRLNVSYIYKIHLFTHSYSSIVTPPTCTERGYTTHTCDCNHSYIDTYVNTLEHSFTNYVSNGDATYEADGTKTAFCDYGCGTSKKIVDEGSKLERLTIQFVADDTIISTQTFDSINKDIVVPACPTKNGFIGKWESFTLGDKSIVVNALYIEKTVWDGTSVASSFWDGDGSEERPYTIATAAHLKYLAKTVNEGNSYEGKYFKLCGDIDLGGHEWEPIGYCNYDNKYVFCGYFDGSNFSILGEV